MKESTSDRINALGEAYMKAIKAKALQILRRGSKKRYSEKSMQQKSTPPEE